MLIGIVGEPNTGKTILMVRYLKMDSTRNRNIIVNMPLFGIPFTEFDIDKFLSNEYNELLHNATLGLDEITVYMDCRAGQSKQNLLMGYLVLQSRKRGIDIYYTTQSLDLVDYNRLVKYTNIIIYANEILNERTGEPVLDLRRYTIIDLRYGLERISDKIINITPYYDMYDTNYIIQPLIRYAKKKG